MAHQIDHADDVYNMAMKMNKKFHLWKNEEDVALAAYLHDIYAEHRDTHHKMSHDFIMKSKDKILDGVSQSRRRDIAKAALEHRASYEGKYSSKLSELIASADRGKPNFKKDWERSTKYHKGNKESSLNHLDEKFGRGGYAKYPKVYEDFYAADLEKRRQQIDTEMAKMK